MKILSYVKPDSLQEAYDILCQHHSNEIIGGGCFLKLLSKEVETAIDLSLCELDYIRETEDDYEIGSYVTLRTLEKYPPLATFMNGILTESTGQVMGVPFRNVATIGGTVVGKYGFSDILTVLLALSTELIFLKKGMVTLESYLENKEKVQDILVGIRIKKDHGGGYFYSLKKTATDFPIVNFAMTKNREGYLISVGSRPGRAILAMKTMAFLSTYQGEEGSLEKAEEILLSEIPFGDNFRGSKAYRQEVVKGLLRRGIKEVNL